MFSAALVSRISVWLVCSFQPPPLRLAKSLCLTQTRHVLHVNLPAPKFQLRSSSSSGEGALVFSAYFSRFFAKVGDCVSIAFAAPRLPSFNRQQVLNFFPLLHGQPAFGS